MDPRDRVAELEQLRLRVALLEEEVGRGAGTDPAWPPTTYYTTYHILAGMVLGLIGAASSLVFNMVGAAMVGRHPLELIRVYLTFPLGEKALEVQTGFALASGCCLYLCTGMLLGIPFQLLLTRYFAKAGFAARFFAAGVLGLAIWLVNFYGILSWLQPALIGGRWIVEQVPVLVAIMTHLVFAWTMVLVSQWGRFTPPNVRSVR
jgi:hypothetical protein